MTIIDAPTVKDAFAASIPKECLSIPAHDFVDRMTPSNAGWRLHSNMKESIAKLHPEFEARNLKLNSRPNYSSHSDAAWRQALINETIRDMGKHTYVDLTDAGFTPTKVRNPEYDCDTLTGIKNEKAKKAPTPEGLLISRLLFSSRFFVAACAERSRPHISRLGPTPLRYAEADYISQSCRNATANPF